MKRILFVIDSLRIGGAEKSLVSLLNLIDSHKYHIDLQLFSYGGSFQKYVPTHINILPELPYMSFLGRNFYNQLSSGSIRWFIKRIKFAVWNRTHKKAMHRTIARYFWKFFSDCFEKTKPYDIAIGYGQGVPTFYVADKADAKMKLGWINAEYVLTGKDKTFQYNIYNKLDIIVSVSNTVHNQFINLYPELEYRMKVMPDLIDAKLIRDLSCETVTDLVKSDKPIILTVGRLEKFQKGYDILLETCLKLRNINTNFIWYVIGEGCFRVEMEKFINDHNLHKHLVLLGAKENPYPYMSYAYIYAQTSRNEGFGLSIAEALILNTPVVTTKFKSVYTQIQPDINGIVCNIEPNEIAKNINQLLLDRKKHHAIKENLTTQKKGNANEISLFYSLIGE